MNIKDYLDRLREKMTIDWNQSLKVIPQVYLCEKTTNFHPRCNLSGESELFWKILPK